MDRTRRCELLARLSDTELANLGALVFTGNEAEVVLQQAPTAGVIMARAIDGARGETFNLGEVLVTECQVAIGPHEGWGMLLGNRPTGSYWAAAIDAALAGGHPEQARIDAELDALVARQDEALQAERNRLAATMVQFETQ